MCGIMRVGGYCVCYHERVGGYCVCLVCVCVYSLMTY